MLCQRCKKTTATVHVTDLVGEPKELHLCDECAEEEGITPHHHNAWGSLTNQLVRAGILVDTGRLAKSKKVSSHARRNPVWKVRG